MRILKKSVDGCRKMEHGGIEFWVNPNGLIVQTDNWSVVDYLVSDGYAFREFYGAATYGHESFYLKTAYLTW